VDRTDQLQEPLKLAALQGTRHAISTTSTGQLEVRLGAGDWYSATQIPLDDNPVRAAQAVAKAEKYFPTSI
jgi:hypothetical protein